MDFVALIQCTSPFTKPSHLQEAVDLLTEEDVDCVFSVTKLIFKFYSNFSLM